MATVVKVSRNPKVGDGGTFALNTQNYATQIDLHDTYTVRFSDGTATIVDAASANDGTTQIPAIGSTYASSGIGAACICVSVKPRRRTDSPCVWEVEVDWKNIPPQGSGSRWNINIDVRPVRYEQDSWQDKTTPTPQSVLASNGQPFNPTLKRIFFDEEIGVSFDCGASEAGNILTATGDGVSSGAKGHYNTNDVTLTVNGVARTLPAKTLLYAAPEYSTIYTGQPPYDWKFNLKFQYRVDGWLDYVPDRGTYKVVDLGASATPRYQKQVFNDAFGQPVSEPLLMNKAGDKLADVAPGSLQTPLFYTFDMHGGADFTSLLSGIS